MPQVQYLINYQRTVDVEVTDAELLVLRGKQELAEGLTKDDVQQAVVGRAISSIPTLPSGNFTEPEWVDSYCIWTDDEGQMEELFDVG